MFERAIANRSCLGGKIDLSECSDESDDESDSSSCDDEENRPMSVHDMRREAAEIIKRPESAVSTNQEMNYAPKNLPRHTVF